MYMNTGQLFWGLFLVGIGIVFLLDNFGTLNATEFFTAYWPLILILIGISLLIGSRPRKRDTVVGAPAAEPSEQPESGTAYGSDFVDESGIFADVSLDIRSERFRGGSVSTVFGDTDIDLRSAGIAEGEHTLKVSGVFGDVEIAVPSELPIDVTGSTVFGSIQVREQTRSGIGQKLRYRSGNYETGERKLRIRCSQVFGDLKIE